MQSKKAIRKRMLALREATSPAQRAEWSAAICGRVAALPEYRAARVLHSFLPMGDEVDVRPLIGRALADGKRVAAPLFVKGSDATDAFEVTSLHEQDFLVGDWGLRVPRQLMRVALSDIDLLVVPLLAYFTVPDGPRGRVHRLGYGIGYYDTLLARVRPDAFKVGVAFAFQRAEAWAVEAHDVALDAVITPEAREAH